MLRNLITITLRVLWRQKLYAGINLLGLSLALAMALIVVLFVHHETSFDRFHSKADRLYILNQHEDPPERDPFGSVSTPFILAPSLQEQSSVVEAAVRLTDDTRAVTVGENIQDVRLTFTEPEFFDLFDFPLIERAAANPLVDLSGAVLSESVAERMFGPGPWLGKTFKADMRGEEREFRVAGVTEDPSLTSSIQFEVLVPFEVINTIVDPDYMDEWFIIWPHTYVLLHEGVSEAQFDAALANLYETHEFADRFGEGVLWYQYLKLTDIHLHSVFASTSLNTSSPLYSQVLAAIALLLVIVVSVNYTSLALGRSVSRAREVGLRKVLGAHGSQLRRQFLGESMLLALIAVPIAWGIAELALPWFNQVAGRELMLTLDPLTLSVMLALVVLIGLTSGTYPALILARYLPSQVLKGNVRVRQGTRFIRGLVVVQFALAGVLLIGALMMGRQLQYLVNSDLGYDGDQVVALRTSLSSPDNADTVLERFREQVSTMPGVQSASAMSNLFGRSWGQVGFDADDGRFIQLWVNRIDPEFVETMDMELVAGRDFSPDRPADLSSGILINEAMARFMGWDDPIGQRLPCAEMEPHEVIGVVKDFNFQSLHNEIQPLMLVVSHAALAPGINDVLNYQGIRGNFLVRLAGDDITGAMRQLEGTWASVAPDLPFDPVFLDDQLNQYYRNERTMGGVVNAASAATVLLAGMGLFGLVSLSVARRTKEIGVRKVLGASVPSVLTLLAREFTGLIVLGSLVAWPVAWWLVNRWLDQFAYHAAISPWLFLAVSGGVLLLAWLTVTLQAWRVAARNPVHALRHE